MDLVFTFPIIVCLLFITSICDFVITAGFYVDMNTILDNDDDSNDDSDDNILPLPL